MNRHFLALALLSCVVTAGCAVNGVPHTIEPYTHTFDTTADRESVFDAALAASHLLNMDVAVLEKESGLIRFESTTLSAQQLDQYCKYPYAHPRTGEPLKTFQILQNQLLKQKAGTVTGRVSISVLVSGHEPSNINVRSNYSASTYAESIGCNSLGKLESRFIANMKSHLRAS